MLDLTLAVTMNDGIELEATPTVAAVIAAEREYGKPATELFANPSIEVMAFLAWRALSSTGVVTQKFDAWWPGVANIETDMGDDAPLGATL